MSCATSLETIATIIQPPALRPLHATDPGPRGRKCAPVLSDPWRGNRSQQIPPRRYRWLRLPSRREQCPCPRLRPPGLLRQPQPGCPVAVRYALLRLQRFVRRPQVIRTISASSSSEVRQRTSCLLTSGDALRPASTCQKPRSEERRVGKE